MNRLAIGFGLTLFLFFNLSINAQQKKTSGDDASSVRLTVTNYIEAYYTGDAARMEQTLHPHYLKHTISGSNGDLTIIDKSGEKMLAALCKEGAELIATGVYTRHVVRKIEGKKSNRQL